MSAAWHIRYSVKTCALFSGNADPIQHAVYDDTLKTACGRNATEYWKLDADCPKHITCSRCEAALAKAEAA